MKNLTLQMLFAMVCAGGVADAAAQANSVPSQPHLLVKGASERVVQPDRFTINLLLQDTDPQPEVARARVQATAITVLADMKSSGAIAETVNASTLTIAPVQEVVDRKQVFAGTRVSRTISAGFASTKDLQGFLGKLQTSDGLQVRGLQTGYSDIGALRAQLKREAVNQARRSAEGLADAYGSRITGLYTISDVAPSFAYGVQAGTWPNKADEGQAIQEGVPPAPMTSIEATVSGSRINPEVLESGTIRISENVYAIFLIGPQ